MKNPNNLKVLIPLLFIVIAALGCSLFSSGAGDSEMVFAATEVGTPQGEKVTKDIGPGGGTLASKDGRLTLIVPKGALTETLPFSIQPITNMAGNGLGLAYRLEPDGKTFTIPLEITVRYDEKDLEGTIPEALSLAYQDTVGEWHLQEQATLDQNKKILTVMTTHFTDWSFLSRLRISPEKATVRVGETLQLKFGPCYHLSNGIIARFFRWIGRVTVCEVTNKKYNWDIQPNWFVDIGTIDRPRELTVIYTAPSKKPNPNVATVGFPYELTSRGDVYVPPLRGMFTSKITIVDPGYKATGSDGPTVYSGVICDLEKPFEVTGKHPIFTFPFKFVPSSATAGTASYATVASGITAAQSGSYTIEGADTDTPRILWKLSGTASIPQVTTSGGGTATIILVPLETDECIKQ